ncbi:MAG: peptidylprolyl isomerase, partial [Proteobacteria bacterium]|nr:peptidylprolyl isomerase [Pseudomonadota bacterium]
MGIFAITAGNPVASQADETGGKAVNPRVLFSTSKGNIVIELYPDKSPFTVENFPQYVKDCSFPGTVF